MIHQEAVQRRWARLSFRRPNRDFVPPVVFVCLSWPLDVELTELPPSPITVSWPTGEYDYWVRTSPLPNYSAIASKPNTPEAALLERLGTYRQLHGAQPIFTSRQNFRLTLPTTGAQSILLDAPGTMLVCLELLSELFLPVDRVAEESEEIDVYRNGRLSRLVYPIGTF